jgi:hypothetical protein
VGGPLTLVLIFLLAMLAAGIHDAWSNRRGVLGWIVSIVCAVIGGFLAVSPLVLEGLLPFLDLNGSLACGLATSHARRFMSRLDDPHAVGIGARASDREPASLTSSLGALGSRL